MKEKLFRDNLALYKNTLFEIFIFVQKFNFDFPRKIVELFWVKTRENAVVFFDFLAVDNFYFARKIVKNILGAKTRENVADLHFLVVDKFDFPKKLESFVKIEFLDKNLTFRIV